MATACASTFNASSYVKNICLSIHIKCITGTQSTDGADERERCRTCAEQVVRGTGLRTAALEH